MVLFLAWALSIPAAVAGWAATLYLGMSERGPGWLVAASFAVGIVSAAFFTVVSVLAVVGVIDLTFPTLTWQ